MGVLKVEPISLNALSNNLATIIPNKFIIFET
jgi:hypothetical protein